MKQWLEDNWLKIAAIALALGALKPFPFAYFQIMNWVVAGAALLTAWQAHKQKNIFFAWVFVFIAVVFNPLAPIYLRSDIWQIADIAAAALFGISFFALQPKKGDS